MEALNLAVPQLLREILSPLVVLDQDPLGLELNLQQPMIEDLIEPMATFQESDMEDRMK
jgi:hypothetical protein